MSEIVVPLWELAHGDCLDVLRMLPDNSVDAVVTDPPAGIEFMGKAWDHPTGVAGWEQGFSASGLSDGGVRLAAPSIGRSTKNPTCTKCGKRQRTWKDGPSACACPSPAFPNDAVRLRTAFVASMTAIFIEVRRVLKPGGHALVWGIPRTVHWTTTALEDAGFEIRDVVGHFFLNGFPKSLNLPDGRGTALKPSREDWILARKPLVGTVAANVTEHGTGALNIDACRVATAKGDEVEQHGRRAESAISKGIYGDSSAVVSGQSEGQKLGRWPPNTVFSHGVQCSDKACEPGCPVAELDRQSGTAVGAAAPASSPKGVGRHDHGVYSPAALGFRVDGKGSAFYKDKGGASRMFPTFDWSAEREEAPHVLTAVDPTNTLVAPFHYFAKAPTKEREAGTEALPGRRQDVCREPDAPGANNPRNRGGKARGNHHPTVKNIALMRWLVKLITPPGGVVLDPFTGSGSTGCAAVLEGFDFVGIEREQEYVDIAVARLTYWQDR